jgi:hypothetical protein
VEKLVYLLWGDGAPAHGDQLRDRLLELAPRLIDSGAHAVTVNVHDSAAAEAPSPVPTPDGEDCHVAEIAIWVDSYDRRGPLETQIVALGPMVAGYLVVESLYEDYGTTPHSGPRSWEDGRRSPGVLTVSLIHRPEGLDYATWIDRWHGTQSPLSGELQPRCRYVRNEVVRPLTDGAPEIHGIVEEAWPSAQHVADPMLFFNAHGDPAVLSEHITAMLDSVNACLDLARIRNVTMSEYLVKAL